MKKLTISKKGWIEPYEGVCPGVDTIIIDLEDERIWFPNLQLRPSLKVATEFNMILPIWRNDIKNNATDRGLTMAFGRDYPL